MTINMESKREYYEDGLLKSVTYYLGGKEFDQYFYDREGRCSGHIILHDYNIRKTDTPLIWVSILSFCFLILQRGSWDVSAVDMFRSLLTPLKYFGIFGNSSWLIWNDALYYTLVKKSRIILNYFEILRHARSCVRHSWGKVTICRTY